MTLSDEEWQEKAEQGLKELIEGATVTKEQIDKKKKKIAEEL